MTKREYFENNKVTFNEVMKEFNENQFKSFDDFLNSERFTYRFKKGDIVVMDCKKSEANHVLGWKKNVVFEILEIVNGWYKVRFLTPHCDITIGAVRELPHTFINNVCELY